MTEDAANNMDSEGGGQVPKSNYDYYNSIGLAKVGSTTVWITPEYIVKWVEKEFGPIGLDAAADVNNSVADEYIDEKMDALVTPWISDDIVWCNPPYGNEAKKFVERAIDQVAKKNCSKVVMLLPVRTDTTMFQDLIFPRASRIHFIKDPLLHQQSLYLRIRFQILLDWDLPEALILIWPPMLLMDGWFDDSTRCNNGDVPYGLFGLDNLHGYAHATPNRRFGRRHQNTKDYGF